MARDIVDQILDEVLGPAPTGFQTDTFSRTELKATDSFQAAFKYAKCKGRPVVLQISGQDWKVYPEGMARPMRELVSL